MTPGGIEVAQPRSWLFAPGHNERHLSKVFDAGADAVLLDLEDAVPESLKDRARDLVVEAAKTRACWVRVNRPGSEACERDLAALVGVASGIRVPKIETGADVSWIAERAPGMTLDCTIESAAGVINLNEIVNAKACSSLSLGTIDLANDLRSERDQTEMLFVRSLMVIASRAAGKPGPSDGVYTDITDEDGLRIEAEAARRLGFSGKSAIHPRQVPIINEVFAASAERMEWARRVLEAFKASGGAATRTANGEFVDLAVVEQARRVLRTAR